MLVNEANGFNEVEVVEEEYDEVVFAILVGGWSSAGASSNRDLFGLLVGGLDKSLFLLSSFSSSGVSLNLFNKQYNL